MKEINIARSIIRMRKEKGITQDELAKYIGVTKSSISKWETEQSYPDITLVPQIASFFNVSIDELMGYEPQMTKEDIRLQYHKLSSDFASKPFEEVLIQCHRIIKKYFSCFPLLFQIGVLLVNYSEKAGDTHEIASIITEAKELFIRVKKESDDVELAKQALNMECACLLFLGNPDEALILLEETQTSLMSNETLLASAYQMTGKMTQAKTALQVGMYQYVVGLFDFLTSYLILCGDNVEQFEENYKRELKMAETFHLNTLHPIIMMNFYLAAAQGHLSIGRKDIALDNLLKYTDLVTSDIYPLELHGDKFFYLIDKWFDDFALGTTPPRDEKSIRQSMVDAIENNAAFVSIAGEPQFKKLLSRLKNSESQR